MGADTGDEGFVAPPFGEKEAVFVDVICSLLKCPPGLSCGEETKICP